jgi:GDPmannose 4,6-dehydratase
MNKTAIITGITGQDGSYLAEYLLSKEYKVIGLYRRSSINNHERVDHLLHYENFSLEEFDLTDPSGCSSVIEKYQPDELYNLAAMSHVGTSFHQPSTTFEIDTIGVINLLESIRHRSSHTKFYQASTSEMFGKSYSVDDNGEKYQDENTILIPQSPYAVAKLASHRMLQIYREAYGLYACSGILFNHESPRRGENFVTRKITKYISSLVNNKILKTTKLKLGNILASRDWGHAKDFVQGMHLMMEHDIPDDYVLCTGQTHTVQDFLELSFKMVGLNYKDHIEIDPQFYRPAEVTYLKGKCDKAKTILGWIHHTSFEDLVDEMVTSDIKLLS